MATVPVLAPTIANNDGWVCCSALQILTAVFDGAKSGQLGDGVIGGLAPSLFTALAKVADPEAISVSLVTSTVGTWLITIYITGRMSSPHLSNPQRPCSVSSLDRSC